jgi:hypothetical protein
MDQIPKKIKNMKNSQRNSNNLNTNPDQISWNQKHRKVGK